jgi:Zeta toxin
MQQASEYDLIYTEEIQPAVFSGNAHDNHRDGSLTACVVFGPPGSGKKEVAQRAEQLLQSHGLKTVTIAQAMLLSAHPERSSRNQGKVDHTICRWRDAAIEEASRRKLGIVITAALDSPKEADALLDSLQTRGYRTLAFAVCTPDTQRSGRMHPNRFGRDHASYTELGHIAEAVKSHASVTKLSLVNRQCQSFAFDGNVSGEVQRVRDTLRQQSPDVALVSRRSPAQARNGRGR